MLLFDFLYFLFLLVAAPFWIKYLFRKRYRTTLKHRFIPDLPPPDKVDGKNSMKKRIWIHAVSVGEVKALKPLIHLLPKLYPHMETILSATTPSGCEVARAEYPDIPVLQAPLDFSFTIRRFIKIINPKILILNELEIWPNWISQIRKHHIPSVLINGRISDGAFRNYLRFRFFLGHIFAKTNRFLVQSEMYRDRFARLGIPPEKIRVTGNIKADEAARCLETLWSREDTLALLKLSPDIPGKRKILTAASSHAGEETILISIIKEWSRDFLFIIAPRHPERTPEIVQRLEGANIRYSIWSQSTIIPPDTEALVFDKMGVLFQLLRISDIVLMGGTFDPAIGGHNLYEPAVLGKPITGGPCFNNFPCLGEELARQGVYHTVHSARDLSDYLAATDSLNLEKIRELGTAIVNNRRGSLEQTVDELRQWLA